MFVIGIGLVSFEVHLSNYAHALWDVDAYIASPLGHVGVELGYSGKEYKNDLPD